MDFGIPTLIEHKNVEDAAKLAHDLGFRFVELNMNLPWAGIDELKKCNLQKISDVYDVYFTIHADENMFFCDFTERIALAHLENMLEVIDFAGENRIPLVNFHMSQGVYFTLPDRKVFLFDQYENVYREKLVRFRDMCSKAAGNKVRLCIENTGLNHSFVHHGVDELLHSPAFGLTWDIGHDYSAHCCDTPFLQERKEKIIHMHLHDAVGRDCHLPLGKGEMDLDSYLKCASPERVVVEVKTIDGLYNSVPWLKKRRYLK